MNPEHEPGPGLEVDVLALAAAAAAEADPALAWRAADGLASRLMNEAGSWVEDYTEHDSLYGLLTALLDGRRLRLTWRPLNPDAGGGADDFLLEDQHRRIYAHAEQTDNDTWWACVYPMEAWEDPHFTGADAKDKAFRYCEEMVHLWHSIRGRVAELDKLTADGRADEYRTRFDVRTTELPMPKRKDLP